MGMGKDPQRRVRAAAQRICIMMGSVLLWGVSPVAAAGAAGSGCLGALQGREAVLVSAPSGRAVLARNESLGCVPASTLKILTAFAAIHEMGLDYRFPTDIFLDPSRNLIVKGWGDPLLTSESLADLAHRLSGRVSSFNDLVLDDTYFDQDIRICGRGASTNPYDAPVGALCANFNTVCVTRDRRGRLVSAEPETPLIPFACEKVRALGVREGRVTFTHERAEATFYAGHLLRHFLEKEGCRMQGEVRRGAVPADAERVLRFESAFTLETVLERMLEFSNNFVANQVFIAMGARRYGAPGTVSKGVRVMEDIALNVLDLDGIRIAEGSGLSRENRLSPLQMIRILEAFSPYRELLRKKPGMLFKTGTLSGVKNLAGYLEGQSGVSYSFAVFLGPSGAQLDGLMDCIRLGLP
ncbi:D-alanyl-D-alanine carboxypeptidase/D-alanyl-D-alanine-endopeptidase [Desulfatiglans anilini]|uniref:D-alanyl-D-alanine carboxypeptidase/D-alanyl-D-alanine-endopeptidase n=1 Tax=Desulfatiglans anilini TaxID=90728 RepID=UPI00041501B8|nr:D-alanyl-D-alanine carboxypeptidase [Desulfatiglans anilini]